MNPTDAIGYLAALCTTAAFVPQVLHLWRSRDTTGISLAMYAVFSIGVALWLAYGLLVDSWPVLIANTVTLVLALGILMMKIRYEQHRGNSPSGDLPHSAGKPPTHYG